MNEKPSDEIPEIDCTLRWEEVSLPPSVSEADLDRIIFSVMTSRLLKTARVIGDASNRCKELGCRLVLKSSVPASVHWQRPAASKAQAISANGATVKCG
jgi:hypothetical protein